MNRNSLWLQLLLLVALSACAAAATAWLHPKAPSWKSRSPEEITLAAAKRLDPASVLWIDARSRRDYSSKHIPGAILLNEDEWESLLSGFVEKWQLQHQVIVYCSSSQCRASHGVADRLKRELGIQGVRVLAGGWESLEAASP